MINHRVRAAGAGRSDPKGQLKGLEAPSIEAQELPASWLTPQQLTSAPNWPRQAPSLGGGADLTDDEFDDFMATIKG